MSRANRTAAARPGRTLLGGSVRSLHYGTSPLLASRTPSWRSRFVLLLVALGFLLLLGRAVQVQVLQSGFYQAQGDKRFLHDQPLAASRGRIVDRHGLPLAMSVALPSVQVDRARFEATPAQQRELARLLGLRPADLQTRLQPARGTVVLRRHVEEPVWQQVRALQLGGVQAIYEYTRRYPEGQAAAHIVGRTDIDERGIEGIEQRFQDQLEGRRGQRTVMRDRLGRVIENPSTAALAQDGRDVVLSIDSKLQFFAWQQLQQAVQRHGARAGSAVVLDATSGEVLALANYPSFDPLRRGGGEAVRNRAITDIFEPGSTMKPFIAALALDSGRVRADTVIDTAPGVIRIGGRPIRDIHPRAAMTVAEIIQKSSNVGTVKMAMQIPPAEMWQLYSAVGMGQRPALEFPGVATGRLRPHAGWRPIEQATMSYGYGLSASLLQLARAYTVFATDGQLMPLTLLKHAPGERPAGQPVMSARTAAQVREMLHHATLPGGTGGRAAAVGYSVGGKTGTARKVIDGAYTDKYRAWFVGLAPVSAPRIVVAVMVDEPTRGGYYGGEVAAPVFSQITQQTLRLMGVAPDMAVEPALVGRAVAIEAESF